MKTVFGIIIHVWICCITSLVFSNEKAAEILVYRRTSDASAAVSIGNDIFIVADDENNTLRVYRTTKGGLPIFKYNMNEFLDIEPEHPEADIEGATRIGRRIYWITSHGRNKDGKIRPNRYRFFATDINVQSGIVDIRPVGKPNKTLIHNLIKSEIVHHLGLDVATRFAADKLSKKERKKLAPKQKGLNIEGLCATADGKTIYIGFRNPGYIVRKSKTKRAIIIPLKNPDDVIENSKAPIFGEPVLLDLTGLGIRSIEYSHFHKEYFIIAGSFSDGPKFALYRWCGNEEKQPVLIKQLDQTDFTPEALITFRNSHKLFILSDDGALRIKVDGAWECLEGQYNKDGTCQNKYLINPAKKTFKGVWLIP
jgi:hypothetical protein